MAMTNAKAVAKLIKELTKMLGHEPSLAELRRALNGEMPKKEDIKVGGTD